MEKEGVKNAVFDVWDAVGLIIGYISGRLEGEKVESGLKTFKMGIL